MFFQMGGSTANQDIMKHFFSLEILFLSLLTQRVATKRPRPVLGVVSAVPGFFEIP